MRLAVTMPLHISTDKIIFALEKIASNNFDSKLENPDFPLSIHKNAIDAESNVGS